MNAWFHATQAKCEVVFEMKLALYEEACAFLESSCHHDAGDDGDGDISGGGAEAAELLLQLLVMEKMRLEGPLKPPKRTGFLDTIEEQLDAVYNGLEEGYNLNAEDTRVFGHAVFPSHVVTGTDVSDSGTGSSVGPQLYGELTSKGVRQLHRAVLQCLERVGIVAQTEEVKVEEQGTQGPHQPTRHAVVGVDVGSGTGKLLFEWSLLVQRDAMLPAHWTHVGVELAPSRMQIARRAMRGSASLVYSPTRQQWRVKLPCGGAGQQREDGDVKVVLCEADVFTPGLLSNETFVPLADGGTENDAAPGDFKKKVSSHLVVFCCGLGFPEPAVCELCASLERMWQKPHMASSAWQSLTCVFLLRAFTGLRSFPLFRLCTETTGPHDASVGSISTIKLNTTWMDEAPALLLSFCRVCDK
ncbi:hypothetical protein TcBrA4_0096450 [Trypanosoma cruzi]|nr:hypothetical protein TcBrA4_0096450 [Trypanosoma cruzi]